MRFSPYIVPVILGLLATASALPASAQFGITISVPIAPPPLPYYEQPPIPEPGYLWTPGYWAYAQDGGYYWVPGTWALPPSVGLLWTPAWWGFADGVYGFHAGYWGPQVGYYGGIDYGYGYGGVGFVGGRWDHGHFAYNSAVNNFGGAHITNVYRGSAGVGARPGRTSFNGGAGGTHARPTPAQEAIERGQHTPATAEQAQHIQAAGANPDFRASANHGRPAVAATARPGAFSGQGVSAARAGAPPAPPRTMGARPAAARAAPPRPAPQARPARAVPPPRPAAPPHPAPPRPAPKGPENKDEHH